MIERRSRSPRPSFLGRGSNFVGIADQLTVGGSIQRREDSWTGRNFFTVMEWLATENSIEGPVVRMMKTGKTPVRRL